MPVIYFYLGISGNMAGLKKGYIQIYTGNGKGKTTAALGLALRAAGAGLKVYIGQFLKGRDCAEIKGLSLLGEAVCLERFGSGRWVDREKTEEYAIELELGRKGIAAVRGAVSAQRYDVVILDEILGAVNAGVVELAEVLAIIRNKPAEIELVLTGRNAPTELIALADLVSEITPVKHYYTEGVPARKGIEF